MKHFRAIDIHSLIGNIGGYVGLLLGVSILQIPSLVLQVVRKMKRVYIDRTQAQTIHINDQIHVE